MSGDKDIATIVNILERIFSDEDGEVVNAARIAKRKMAALGMTKVSDLFNHFIGIGISYQAAFEEERVEEKPEPKTKPKQDEDDRRFAAFAFEIFNHPDFEEKLSDKQKGAVENWTTWSKSFSDKQRIWMMAIGEKLGLRIDDDFDQQEAA